MNEERLDCPNTEALCGFVEGRLDRSEREAFERHVDACSACRRALVEVGRALGEPAHATSMFVSPSDAPHSPRLGRYEIRCEIGVGGMGVVYEGWDPALGRRVALKLMRPDRLDPGFAERLAAEARALAKIAHPNVLTVFDVGIEGESVFLAAEYVDGTTMDGGWPHRARAWRERVGAYLQAARGLAAVHAAGLTHRDVKPSNILLGADGRVRLTDFGLAIGAGDRAIPAGTRAYMAPEQWCGEVGPAVDQFALAVCLAEALLGMRMPAGTSPDELERRGHGVWGDDEPPPALWTALARALAIDPSARHPDVGAFVRSLEACVEAHHGPPAKRRRAVLAAAGGVGVALLVGLVALEALRAGRAGTSSQEAVTAPVGAAETAPASASASVSPGSEPAVAAAPESAVPHYGASASVPPGAEPTVAAAPEPAVPHRAGRKPVRRGVNERAPAGDDASRVAGRGPGEAVELYKAAGQALVERNGAKCLALLDEAERLTPDAAAGFTQLRASCEMLVGRCEQGFRRVLADAALGETAELAARQLRFQYCSVEQAVRGSAEERLELIAQLGGRSPHSIANCEYLASQAELAVRERGSTRLDAALLDRVWSGMALCFASTGDCARAKPFVERLLSEKDRAARTNTALAALHPNCAAAVR